MERYKKYMDDIAVPDELHERFRNPKKKRKTPPSRVLAGAAAACLVFGLIFLPGIKGNQTGSSPNDTTAAGAVLSGAGENGVEAEEGWDEEAEAVTEAGGPQVEKGAKETHEDDDQEAAWPEAGAGGLSGSAEGEGSSGSEVFGTGGAAQATPENGTGTVEELPETETLAGNITTGRPAQEDFLTFLPAMEAADFSGWERKEPFGDIVLNAEGSWAFGTKKLSVTVRLGIDSEANDEADWLIDSARREIRVTFWEGEYQLEYLFSGTSEKEAEEIMATVRSQRSEMR